MPHAERYFSREFNPSLEPSLKKSKLDYSTLCKKKNTEEYIPIETQSQEWNPSTFSGTGYYGSDKGEHKEPRVNEDFLNGYGNEKTAWSSWNYSSEAHYSRRENSNNNLQVLELPTTDALKNNNSEATFSETSSAFIGPVYHPPSQVESLSRANHGGDSKSLSFKITTVPLGKAGNKTKGENGMDYELRQFYKELFELEATTDDHNISQGTADSWQHFSCKSKASTNHQARDPHSPKSFTQPSTILPNKPSALISPRYHQSETPISPPQHPAIPPISQHELPAIPPHSQYEHPAIPPISQYDHPAIPPINNQHSCKPVAFDRTRFPFVNQSLPLPRFQGLPPPFGVVHHGPPPTAFKYPLIFPRAVNMGHSPYHTNENYHSANDHPQPRTQAPWHNLDVLPENRFCFQGRGYTEPFPRPPVDPSQQSYQRKDCEQNKRHFNELRLPQSGNLLYEQYPPRFRETAQCTDFKRKLVLLRGVPGSGKSTLARTLLNQSPDGIVFSTDDYFCQENGYTYDVKLLGDAHSWNQNRARRAMDEGKSPIIIDNTNIQGWEMKPYVQMAIERNYSVEFLEPNTWWKLDPHELEKRNTHRVPREKISQMLERFEYDMNVGAVMNSVEPRRVRSSRPPPDAEQRWGASLDCTHHSMSFQIR